MFSLVITIISIALVAALALATLFYGGGAYTQAQANAKAAQLRNQGQQLLGAAELFKATQGRYPDDIPEMVALDYLKSEPQAASILQRVLASQSLSSAWAADKWDMPLARTPVFTIDTPEPETCRSINEESLGAPGILPRVQGNVMVQCFGPATTELLTVVGRNYVDLQAVALAGTGGFTLAELSTDALPAPGAAGWTVDPNLPRNVQAGSGANNGAGGDGGSDADGPADDTPTFRARLEPSSLPFGNVAVGLSLSLNAELVNIGNRSLTVTAPTITGEGFVTASDNCPAELAVGDACTVTVQFAPQAQGAASGTLTFNTNATNGPLTVALSGQGAGVTGNLAAATTTDFGAVVVGNSASREFTFTNTGSASAPGTYVNLAGANLALVSNTCGTQSSPVSIPAGDSCSFQVRYSPSSVSTLSGASVSVVSPQATNGPFSQSLSGSGVLTDVASGGTITTYGDYAVHRFTAAGLDSFVLNKLPVGSTLDILVVGGGGAGSWGGGGAGGVLYTAGYSLAPGTYSLKVGEGGAGVRGSNVAGNNGEDSFFDNLVAKGGGGGGKGSALAKVGGSGGGGSGGDSDVRAPGAGTPGQGLAGGRGGSNASGGGGGAGQAGDSAGANAGGDGGQGRQLDITGTPTYYGGGGGGISFAGVAGNPGGLGGGGRSSTANSGGTITQSALPGEVNTGGGGGGTSGSAFSGSGGRGVVIVRYRIR